ncbi:MAG: tetratricopeptide repeat protein [Gemmataceae bacterium]
MADFDNDGTLDLFVTNAHGTGLGVASIEGAYLKGQGIVFNIVLPMTGKDELNLTQQVLTPKAASDWETTRRQLRGEKSEAPASAKKSTVADILLKVLAENGKNFSQLPPNESVTLAVTFRGQANTGGGGGMMPGPGMGSMMGGGPAAGGSGMGPMPGAAGPGGAMGPTAGGSGGGPPMGPGGKGGPNYGAMGGPGIGPGGGDSAGGPLTADRELELLGDLHVKRGNLSEAASAYDRARKQAGGDQARVRELSKKLAEIYLKIGNLEAARKALEVPAPAAAGSGALTASGGGGSTGKPAPAMKLPGKLIVSAPKQLLDQVAGEHISVSDFQKQVTFDVFPGDAPPKSSN